MGGVLRGWAVLYVEATGVVLDEVTGEELTDVLEVSGIVVEPELW